MVFGTLHLAFILISFCQLNESAQGAVTRAGRPALNCVQCNSITDPSCGSNQYKPPTPCEPMEHYCMMFFVMFEQEIAVVKKCSESVSSGCFIRNVGSKNATICYHTCNTDGCNTNRFGNRLF